jgi:hypothetical protein
LRLHKLVNRIATKTLQDLFTAQYRKQKGVDWRPELAANLVIDEKDTFYKQLNGEQKLVIQAGIVDDWDMSLLSCIFLNSDMLSENNNNAAVLNKLQVKKLKDTRNFIAHNAKLFIHDTDFERLWNEISQILVVSGFDANKLSNLKTVGKKIKFQIFNIITDYAHMEAVAQNGVPSEEMEKLKMLANDAFKKENYSDAVNYYSDALKLPLLSDINRGTLYSNRSVAYLKQGEFEKALVDAKLTQQLRPDWPRSYYRKGCALHALKKFQKSVEGKKIFKTFSEIFSQVFEMGLILDPTNEELIFGHDHANVDYQELLRNEHMDSNFNVTLESMAEMVTL